MPGSRYENSVVVSDNQFINDWIGVDIWQSGQRSCENSGESGPGPGTDDSYCSGGFPIPRTAASGGKYYFSHIGDSAHGGPPLRRSLAPTTEQAAGGRHAGPRARGPRRSTTRSASRTPRDNDHEQAGRHDPQGPAASVSANTAGFPSSGELRVGTSAAWSNGQGSFTGAILAYTGTTASRFTGVTLVRGTGTLSGPVQQVQPYRVTAEKCFANDCLLTVSPRLASAQAAGATVTNAGTCQLFATSAALPSGPLAPDGVSYWDGCQWQARDISVTGNDFVFQPTAIAASAPLTGGKTTSCTAAHADDCGTNFMAYQDAGEAPFGSQISANAMMSQPSLTGCPAWDASCPADPLANLNGLASPPGAPRAIGKRPTTTCGPAIPIRGPGAGPLTSSVAALRCPPTRRRASPCHPARARQTSASGSRRGARTSIQRAARRYRASAGWPGGRPGGHAGNRPRGPAVCREGILRVCDIVRCAIKWGTAGSTARHRRRVRDGRARKTLRRDLPGAGRPSPRRYCEGFSRCEGFPALPREKSFTTGKFYRNPLLCVRSEGCVWR